MVINTDNNNNNNTKDWAHKCQTIFEPIIIIIVIVIINITTTTACLLHHYQVKREGEREKEILLMLLIDDHYGYIHTHAHMHIKSPLHWPNRNWTKRRTVSQRWTVTLLKWINDKWWNHEVTRDRILFHRIEYVVLSVSWLVLCDCGYDCCEPEIKY